MYRAEEPEEMATRLSEPAKTSFSTFSMTGELEEDTQRLMDPLKKKLDRLTEEKDD